MTLDDLRAFGANVDEGLGRCMGMEAVYLRLAGTIKNEAGFSRLEDALAAGDLDEAFEASHALKGVLGNLSLTPLYDPMNELCEALRASNRQPGYDYAPLLATITERLEQFRAL